MKNFILFIGCVFLSIIMLSQTLYSSELESLVTPKGTIQFKTHIPPSYANNSVPLVVVLHGCSQDADKIANGTRWNDLANSNGFIVLYPQQSKLRNTSSCWNWFFTNNQHRGMGEPYLIAEATKFVMNKYKINHSKVYICGMSAGAAMAVITAICYPDIFAAVGSHSGLEYAAATSAFSAETIMKKGGPDPESTAEKAYKEILKAGTKRNSFPSIIFHGTSDDRVNIINGDQTVEQFVILNERLGSTMKRTEKSGNEGKSYRLIQYKSNTTLVEYWIVEGLEHAWAGGSSSGGPYNDPVAPNATQHMWEFFKGHSL